MSQDESSPIRVAAEKEKRRRLGVKNLADIHEQTLLQIEEFLNELR